MYSHNEEPMFAAAIMICYSLIKVNVAISIVETGRGVHPTIQMAVHMLLVQAYQDAKMLLPRGALSPAVTWV
ncbi:unnamed protein product [Clonostachys rhizophaga]|uniref:Uncharacterized protein n=1 Tax=Clonostachys rhizophaga TaxID=160324 RepID=A0A9N9VU34_9HYPO|nr:unnamed protein product [Clonostachys rhizophaga]